MPFNGSGGFTRVMNWQADRDAGVKIRADRHDQEDDNFASGLSNVICKDGQTVVTADIPWNGKKLTNIGNPVNPQDAATKAYSVAKAGDTMTGNLSLPNNTLSAAQVDVTPAGTAIPLLRLLGPSSGTNSGSSGLLGFYDNTGTRKGYAYYSNANTRMELWADSGNMLIGTAAGSMGLQPSTSLAVNAGTSISLTASSGTISLTSVDKTWSIGGGGTWQNATVPTVACAMRASFAGAGSQYGLILYSGSSAASNQIQFYNGTSPGTLVGSIVTSGAATAYNTSSDERLKTFTGPLSGDDAIAIIRADPVRRFIWNTDGVEAVGWGAQTSYEVSHDLASPPVVDAAKPVQPGPGEDGFQPWGMDQAKRTPYLWAALAWALDQIDAHEARIAALEAA